MNFSSSGIGTSSHLAEITATVISELHAVAALPKGVVNLVSESGHAVAQALVASSDVDVISFTGSNATGQRIMAAAAPTMKKLSLELGGKASCLVFDDVDVNKVAAQLAAAATIISGQQCTAARRVLVHASRYDAMKAALGNALSALVVAPRDTPGAHIGPLIDGQSLEKVGARIRAGDECGRRSLTPTLIAHRDTSAFFVREEFFGPLVVLKKFDDEAEAVKRANHIEYCLSASVWTTDGARALRVARCATAPSGSTITTSCSRRPRPAAIARAASAGCTASTA